MFFNPNINQTKLNQTVVSYTVPTLGNLAVWHSLLDLTYGMMQQTDILRTVKVDQFNRIVSNLIGTPLDQEVK